MPGCCVTGNLGASSLKTAATDNCNQLAEINNAAASTAVAGHRPDHADSNQVQTSTEVVTAATATAVAVHRPIHIDSNQIQTPTGMVTTSVGI